MPVSSTRLALAEDKFDRANVDPIPSPWQTYSGINNVQIVSNAVESSIINAALDCAETHTATLPNDQWAQVTLASFVGGATYFSAGLYLRFAAPNTVSGYFMAVERNAGPIYHLTIYKYAAGVSSVLGGPAVITAVAGDVYSFEAIGTQLTAYQNDTQVVQVASDSSYSGGVAGIEAYATQTVADVVLDSFSCGGFMSLFPQAVL